MIKAAKKVVTTEMNPILDKTPTKRKIISEGIPKKKSTEPSPPAKRQKIVQLNPDEAKKVLPKLHKSRTTLLDKPKLLNRSKSISDASSRSKAIIDAPKNKIENLTPKKTTSDKPSQKLKTQNKKSATMDTQPSLHPARSEATTKLLMKDSLLSEMDKEKMEMLKKIVNQAELDRRIFCVINSHRYTAQPIREELLKRGWEEFHPEKGTVLRKNRSSPPKISTAPNAMQDTEPKTNKPVDRTEQALVQTSGGCLYVAPPNQTKEPQKENQDISDYYKSSKISRANSLKKEENTTYRTPSEAKFISKFIAENNVPISMIWLTSKPEMHLPNYNHIPNIVNKFQKTTFCTKLGLWLNLKRKQEINKYLNFPVQTPRMYNLGDTQSFADFTFDFYTTALTSILRWLVSKLTDEGIESVSVQRGRVPQRVFDYVIKKSQLLINYLNGDKSVTREDIMRSEASWRNLILWFYKLVNEQEKLELLSTPNLYILHSKAAEVLRALRQIKPESVNDGITNLWIVKPYSASCGRGIFITNNFHYLERLKQKRYIIQKYIEHPLLISGIKFDIRQWFMVTSLSPLQIWMYKECYLRFCSVPFSLQNLHESAHLTNNAIQRKYAKTVGLHYQNMWDSNTFQRYLRETGHPKLWEERIYPGMRDALIAALLCSKPTFDNNESRFPPRSGWFEIYGADFLLTQNLREGPWLIEINENPALDPSTPVTARLCRKMLRDVIKVVVDWKNDPQSDTGEWHLVFSGPSDNEI